LLFWLVIKKVCISGYSITDALLVQILENLKASREGLEVVTLGRDKDSGRSLEQFESLYSLIKNECPENQKLKVGILQKDKNEGPMVDEWSSFFSNKKLDYDIVDISSSISPILALKDSQEIVIIICDYIILFLETY
jgi:nucleosome binding factor SPN SPT16 subunit